MVLVLVGLLVLYINLIAGVISYFSSLLFP